MSIKENMTTILKALSKAKRNEMGNANVKGVWIHEETNLSPADINDAVTLLEKKGLVHWLQVEIPPYKFMHVEITPDGRQALQE
jgi:DNA-binding MarR family transcriptional regulator